MKTIAKIIKISALAALVLLVVGLCGCGKKDVILNKANLSLDLGIGNTHFADESDYPAPSADAYLDVSASKIVIRNAYEDSIIETPFIYNTSSTAYPRMKLETCRNKMFVVYCPDISMPNIQFASTDNGGRSWEQSTLALKTEMDTIDNFIATFWTPRDGVLVAVDGTIRTFIYITSDSGKTWQLLESAPPEQDWHNLLEHSTFLNRDIGIISYDNHSKAANEPNVYLTTDGGGSWRPLYISVPESVMAARAKAGVPFYDSEKINIPIDIYDENNEIVKTVYFVSYDLAQSWEFFVDDGGKAELLRREEAEKWAAANRLQSLLFADYETVDLAEYDSIYVDDSVRVDIYGVDIAYTIGDREWSRFKLTYQMYFDDQMRLRVRNTAGTTLLFFIYEGDVFNYTYEVLGSMGQKEYSKQSSEKVLDKMIREKESKDLISELLDSAITAYSWFTPHVTVEISNSQDSISVDGYTYFKALLPKGITEEGLTEYFETKQELTEYLCTIFTENEVDNILRSENGDGAPVFTEVNGVLYRLGDFTSKYTNADVQFNFKTTLEGSKKAILSVTVEKDPMGNDISLTYDCELTLTQDGWRFDSFELPIAHLTNAPGPSGGTSGTTITNILDWSKLEYTGDVLVYEMVRAIIYGNYSDIADILKAGLAVDYVYLGPLNDGTYKISKRTKNGVDTIVIQVDDPVCQRFYTKYIRQTGQGITLTDS